MPALFRRRMIWWPTLWGWASIAAGLGLGVTAVIGGAQGFLAQHAPAAGPDGRPASVLVVEGFLDPDDLDQVIAAEPQKQYAHILTSGLPSRGRTRYASEADWAAAYLRRRGIDTVVAVPAPPADTLRTHATAVAVRDWIHAQGWKPAALDVYTAGAHARRTRTVYQMAFGPGVTVGVIPTRPDYDPHRWWASSEGARTVIAEGAAWLWTACCFWPEPGP